MYSPSVDLPEPLYPRNSHRLPSLASSTRLWRSTDPLKRKLRLSKIAHNEAIYPRHLVGSVLIVNTRLM
jgi:hypothetical protein